jgi:hypothetical protein
LRGNSGGARSVDRAQLLALGKFQPLANAYGRPRGEYVPLGYMLWIRTWMTDETNYHAHDLIFHPGNREFDPSQLPARVFDSEKEKGDSVNRYTTKRRDDS